VILATGDLTDSEQGEGQHTNGNRKTREKLGGSTLTKTGNERETTAKMRASKTHCVRSRAEMRQEGRLRNEAALVQLANAELTICAFAPHFHLSYGDCERHASGIQTERNTKRD
jgi:hypothetical protein